MDDLWAGTTNVRVAGPSGPITLRLTLAERPAGTPLASTERSLSAPVSAAMWRAKFADMATDPAVEKAYDSARWARVNVDAGRNGSYAVEFERSLPPLRWRLEDGPDGWTMTLHDDGESSTPPAVTMFSFTDPNVAQSKSVEPLRPFVPDVEGGMYLAVAGTHAAAEIVPPKLRILRDFRELAYRGQLARIPNEAGAIAGQFRVLRHWSGANLPGDPRARTWRAHVSRDLHAALIRSLVGQRWADRENAVFRERSLGSLDRLAGELSSPSPAATSHARAVAGRAPELNSLPLEHRIEAVRLLMSEANLLGGQPWQRLSLAHPADPKGWVAELFLRLATDPAVDHWAASSMADGVVLAIGWPLPLRVARVLALATVVGTSEPNAFPPLFAGWEWP